jgi:acyl-CoA synthetase (AMP-forming)/AMP-acid ligase II
LTRFGGTSHIYGQVVLMAAALWQGATLVTMPRFDLEQFLTILQDCRVSRAAVVPPVLLALAKHPLVDQFDLSALTSLGSGAAPLGAELEEACGKRLGCLVSQGYGLTETSPTLTAHPSDEARVRHGSAGQLLPNTEAKVVDPTTGRELGRNQTAPSSSSTRSPRRCPARSCAGRSWSATVPPLDRPAVRGPASRVAAGAW